MEGKIYQVDAFTSKPFHGNPAAVCILEEPRDETWMQDVAREMNLSETAFLHEEEDGYRLRWFTPVTEVDLCGHATLASAHVLWETNLLGSQEQAQFHTLSGLLKAKRKGEEIELVFRRRLREEQKFPSKEALVRQIHLDVEAVRAGGEAGHPGLHQDALRRLAETDGAHVSAVRPLHSGDGLRRLGGAGGQHDG